MKKIPKYLMGLASSVESGGLEDNKTSVFTKLAAANQVISQLTMHDLPKILAGAAALTIGTRAVGSVMDKISDKSSDLKYEYKKTHTILPFAKKQHPGLKRISDERLGGWLDSARAMAPKVAKDKMLASTYLSNVHSMGGQVDISTASTLSQIGKNTSSSGGLAESISGNIGGSSGLLQGAIGG